ncbi:hypothetical protein [Skermanella aerolata]|nr:hypothetical protein [Skermanella aerolata]
MIPKGGAAMIKDEIAAAVSALDAVAERLRGTEHAAQFAILRAQLLNLARKAAWTPDERQNAARKAHHHLEPNPRHEFPAAPGSTPPA